MALASLPVSLSAQSGTGTRRAGTGFATSPTGSQDIMATPRI
jgi:hypothetical protein